MAIRRANPKCRIVQVPITNDQFEEIRLEAERRDVTMASVIRQRAFDDLRVAPASQ